MSNQKDNVVIVTDNRLVPYQIPRPVLRGAKSLLYKQWPAVSASNGAIHFSCPTPLQGTDIDRSIQILCPARVTCTAVWSIDQNGQYLAQPNKTGIRSYPIQKACQRIDVTLNNHKFGINIGDIITALEHFNTSRKLKLLEYSKTSTYGTCECQKFSDMNLGIRSSLSTFEDSISGISPQNFPFTVYQNTAAAVGNSYTATCKIDFVSIENLWISPLYWGESAEDFDAFSGISTLDVQLQFYNSNPGFRMIAIDNTDANGSDRGGTITGDLQVSFTSADAFSFADLQPKLLVTYLNPQDPRPLNQPLKWPYYQIDNFVFNHDASIASYASDVIECRDILLHKLPTKLFIWARKPTSTFLDDPFTPDCFTSIENLQLSWNNRTVLGEAHKGQLYDLSVRNGLQYEYAEWSGYLLNKNLNVLGNFGTQAAQFGGTGSIVCIDTMDLGLDDHITLNPAKATIPLGVKATVKNLTTASFTPEIHIVAVYDGVMKLEHGVVTTQLGIDDTKLDDADIKVSVPRRVGSYLTAIPTLIRKSLRRDENDPLRTRN